MKSLIGIAAVLLIAICISVYAAGGADYGRGAETDPVASAAVTALSTNLNASNLTSGTVPNARLDADLQALAVNNGSAVTNLSASNIASGTLDAARLPATAVVTDGAALLTEGFFDVVDTTQLVFIASGVTNVIDADITTP